MLAYHTYGSAMRQYGGGVRSGAEMVARSEARIEESLRLQAQTVALLEAILEELRRRHGGDSGGGRSVPPSPGDA